MIQRVDPPDFPDFPEPAELDADKPEGREDSPQVVRAIAVGMPILGLIGGGAFTFGLAALGSEGQFPFSFAVGLIAVLCMMAGVTVIALNLLRQSQNVGKQTDELLSRYFEPETAAVKTVTTLGDAIRREIGKLSGDLDVLTNRIGHIEKRLQEQSGELAHAMDRLEQRAKATSQTLSDERERMETSTRALNDQTQSAAQSLDEQITAARTAMDQASGRLDQAGTALNERIAALSESARMTEAGAAEASGILEKQAGRVSEISQSALDSAKRATDRYQNQHRMLTEAIDKLTEEAGRMDRVFDTQRQSLRDIAEATAKQSERIEEVLGECAKSLGETLDTVGARASSIGSIFTDQSEAILSASDDASGALMRAAEAARASADSAQHALQEQAETSQRALSDQLAEARAVLGGLTEETTAALQQQLEASRGALDSLLSELRGLVDTRLQQARGLFEGMIGDFDRTIEEQISTLREHRDNDRRDWDAWRDRIGTALEGVRLQARDSLKVLDETADKVEERLSGLPARLTGDSETIRKTVSDQVAALDALASSAKESVAAIEALLSGLPDKLSASSDDFAGRIKAQSQAIDELAQSARSQLGDLEHMFDRLPRRVDGQAAHIRAVLDAQMEKIDELAALAARRAQDVAELRKAGPTIRPQRPEAADTVQIPEPPKRGSGAPEGPASASGKGNGGAVAPDGPAAGNQDLSVQEILAQREVVGKFAARGRSGNASGTSSASAAERPEAASAPPEAAGDPEALRQQPDSRLEQPANIRRRAQQKEGHYARGGPATPPQSPADAEPSEIPSFLRRGRPNAGDGQRRTPPQGRAAAGEPGQAQDAARPQEPAPIFRKRFANFDDPPPSGDSDGKRATSPPDDPVSFRTGPANVQKPHPAAARRATMMREAAMTGGNEGEEASAPGASEPASRPPNREDAPAEGPRGKAAPEDASEEDTAAPDFEDCGPPPIPSALRKSMVRQDSRDNETRDSDEPDAAETSEKQARSGRLGWSDILAAADRASHEDRIPRAETGLDPDTVKARNAVPEGPALGTPELQAVAREIVSVLQTLSLDLRPVWRETLPPEVIRRFLKGDKRALTRRLPVMGGMEAMARIRRRYRSEPRFRSNVDLFVQEFDVLVDQIHGLDAARAEKYMSSQNGRLFILLTQVLSKS